MNQDTDPGAGDSAPSTCRVSLRGGALPPMVSYAQNFEDVVIRRALQDLTGGFYIDVGAYDSAVDSVTQWFYQNGWRGVNVEPFPELHAKLQLDRPEDINLWCALGADSGFRPFHVIGDTGLSTLVDDQAAIANAAGYPTSSDPIVPVQTLSQILECYGEQRVIDFLKIDVEGSEEEILNATSFSGVRPRLLIVEAVRPFTLEPAWARWEPKLLSRGYRFAWFDGLNRFYVRQEDDWRLALFGIPPGLFDNFKLAAHDLALNQLSLLQTHISHLQEQLMLVSAGNDGCDGLSAQIAAVTAELALRECALAEASAEGDALRARTTDLSADPAGLECTQAAGSAAGDIVHNGPMSLAATSRQAEHAIAEWSARSSTLEAQVTRLVVRLKQCEQSLAAKHAECDARSSEAEALKVRIGAHEQDLQAKEIELRGLSVRLGAAQREAHALAESSSQLGAILAEKAQAQSALSDRLQLQNQQLAALTTSAESATAELRRHSLEITDLKKQRAALHASLSWRITAPIRRAAKLLRPDR